MPQRLGVSWDQRPDQQNATRETDTLGVGSGRELGVGALGIESSRGRQAQFKARACDSRLHRQSSPVLLGDQPRNRETKP